MSAWVACASRSVCGFHCLVIVCFAFVFYVCGHSLFHPATALSSQEWTSFLSGMTSASLSHRGKLLALGGDGHVFANEEKGQLVFVRDCYKRLFDLVDEDMRTGSRYYESKQIVLLGTPGIGKSWFIVYMLWRLYNDRDVTGIRGVLLHGDSENIKGFVWLDFHDPAATRYMGLWSGDQASSCARNGDVVYIVDGTTDFLSLKVPMLCVWSPKIASGFGPLHKEASIRQWWVPLWSEEELRECRRLCCDEWLDEELMNRRFHCYGKIPRYVLMRLREGDEKEDAIPSLLDEVLDDPLQVKRAFNDLQSKASQRLIHISVADDFKTRERGMASYYVAVQLMLKHNSLMVRWMSNPAEGAMFGLEFEKFGHVVLHRVPYRGRIRLLSGPRGRKHAPTQYRVTHKRMEEFDDVERVPTPMEAGVYYVPTSPNFAAVDSFSTYGMFQFTVNTRHGIKWPNVERLLDRFYPHADAAHPVKFFFCVPSEMFLKYPRQNFKQTDKNSRTRFVEQYALEVSLTCSEAVVKAVAVDADDDSWGVRKHHHCTLCTRTGHDKRTCPLKDAGAGDAGGGGGGGASAGTVSGASKGATTATATTAGMKRGRRGTRRGNLKRGRHG